MEKRSRVKEIYDYCVDNNLPMLSDYEADFWEVYRENHSYFDRLFMKTYKEFMVFSNDSGSVEENSIDFILDVTSWLMANDKRYSELWRIETISDSNYNMLNPYDVTESHTIASSSSMEDNMGSKTDTKQSSINFGAVTETSTNSYVHGAKSESDSESLSYGKDVTTTETESTIGSQQNTNENKVSAFNESSYSPKDYQDTSLGSRDDSSTNTETRDSHSDSKSGTHTEDAYTDTESKSRGSNAHTDSSSDTNIYGAHTNTHTGSESETKSISKHGNLGVFSPSKLLGEHSELWTAYSFYKLIFDEIAEQFLRIVY